MKIPDPWSDLFMVYAVCALVLGLGMFLMVCLSKVAS